MDPDKRSAWLRKLDEECPYQVVLPRRQLTNDSEIMNFLLLYAGKFDMYGEDECARMCGTALRTRWMPRSFDHALSQKARRLGSRVETASDAP
jgi:hypothetical protein